MANITLKQLAKHLNLAVSTVSKALNDSYEISDETKLRVRKAAEEMNYKPNILAKSLKTGKTNTIAVIIPYLSNPFQSQLLEGAQLAAYDKNYKLIFMQSRENSALEKECLDFLRQQNVDGIVITPSSDSDLTYLKELNDVLPIVLVDRIDFDLDTHKIGIDNEKGAFSGVDHLIRKGYNDIIVLSGKNIGVSKQRINGYKKALLTHNLPFNDDLIIKVDYGLSKDELLKNLTHAISSKLKKYEGKKIGVLGTTDTLTVSILGILAQLKVDVPGRVGVIGFANTEEAESMNPSLSTIVQPAKDIGYKGVVKLVQLIEAKKRLEIKYEKIVISTTLELRESTLGRS